MKDKLLVILKMYQKKEGIGTQSAIRDALTDLMHLAEENGVDFDSCLVGADAVFAEESQ